jgi:hypothetical protein
MEFDETFLVLLPAIEVLAIMQEMADLQEMQMLLNLA